MLPPLAFVLLCAALAADAAGAWLGAKTLWTAGWYLMAAGAGTGALVLLVDVARIARGARPGRSAALRRLLAGPLAVALTALGWWVRGDAAIPPDPAVLLVEALVLALLVLAGWPRRPARVAR